jgi:hypothetical protein
VARGVTDQVLIPWKADFISPRVLADKVVAADKVVTV